MPALAPVALALSVVLSALGAVVLCLLVVLYGFTPAGEEPPGSTARRLLVTRIGHVVAAFCFTATAILIAVVLAQPPRPVATVAAVADARVPALGAQVEAQASRMARTEARLDELERSLRRDAARAPQPPPPATTSEASAATARGAEPPPTVAVSGPPTAAARRAAAEPVRPAPGVIWERPAARPYSVARPAPAAPRPHDVEGPALKSSPRAPAASPPTAPVEPPRQPLAESPPPAVRPAPERGLDLGRRLREDWKTIRRGLEAGEEDFWRVVDDTRRKIRRIVE